MKKATILIISLFLGIVLTMGCSPNQSNKDSYKEEMEEVYAEKVKEEKNGDEKEDVQDDEVSIPKEDTVSEGQVEPGVDPGESEEMGEEDPLEYAMGEWNNRKSSLDMFELAALYITRLGNEWVVRVWQQQEGSMFGFVEEEVVKVTPAQNSLTVWTKSPLGVERKLGIFRGANNDLLRVTERITKEGRVTGNIEHGFKNISRFTDLCAIDFQTFGDATGESDLVSVCLTDGEKIWAQSMLFNNDVIHVEQLPLGKTFRLEEMFVAIRMMEKKMPPSFGGGPGTKLKVPVVPTNPTIVQNQPAIYKIAGNETWTRPAISKNMLSSISQKKTSYTKELKNQNLKIWKQLEKNDLQHFNIKNIKEGQILDKRIETGNVKHFDIDYMKNRKNLENIKKIEGNRLKNLEEGKVKRIDGSKLENPKYNRYRQLDKKKLERVKEKKEGGGPSSYLHYLPKAEWASFKNGIKDGHLVIIPSKESFSCSDQIVELEMTYSDD